MLETQNKTGKNSGGVGETQNKMLYMKAHNSFVCNSRNIKKQLHSFQWVNG